MPTAKLTPAEESRIHQIINDVMADMLKIVNQAVNAAYQDGYRDCQYENREDEVMAREREEEFRRLESHRDKET